MHRRYLLRKPRSRATKERSPGSCCESGVRGSAALRPWLARTQNDYARTLFDRDDPGDRERAQELLDQALATYRELGMESYAAKASLLAEEAVAPAR